MMARIGMELTVLEGKALTRYGVEVEPSGECTDSQVGLPIG